MVCGKVVCERWCGGRWSATKLCVKDGVVKEGVRQSCVWKVVWWKMVCDKVVCERVLKEGVSKMVCERVCDRVWKMVCDKDSVWHHSQPNAIRATPAAQNDRGCEIVPHLPSEIKVDVTKCHACHAKVPRRHGCEINDCATPATWNQGGCHQVPRLPRKSAAASWMWDCATPATWNQGWCHQVPRLPRKVPRRHGRHGRHARLNRAQGRHPVPWVRRLPRKTTVDVNLCHTCHVKSRWMSPSAAKCRGVTGVTGVTRD